MTDDSSQSEAGHSLYLLTGEQEMNMSSDKMWRYRLCFLDDETDSLFYISEKVFVISSASQVYLFFVKYWKELFAPHISNFSCKFSTSPL